MCCCTFSAAAGGCCTISGTCTLSRQRLEGVRTTPRCTRMTKLNQNLNTVTLKLHVAEQQLENLRSAAKTLDTRRTVETVITRAALLALGTALTVLLFRLNMIDRGLAVYVLPLVLFILLSLPLDQIKTMAAKWKKPRAKRHSNRTRELAQYRRRLLYLKKLCCCSLTESRESLSTTPSTITVCFLILCL